MAAVVDIEISGIDQAIADLDAMIARCDDLSPVAPAVLDDLLFQNRGIKLFRRQKSTLLAFQAPASFIIGSKNASYAKLINSSSRYLLDILTRYILDGDIK